MEEEVKLVVAHNLEGQEQQFYIFQNIVLGEGGFGIVKKATAANDKSHQLAVKIVPYGGDQIKRGKIERQINILRILPQHPNLVRVLPIKCFSQQNFYIFMQLCKDGTLSDIVRQPGFLQEKQIFNIFWQLMSGYRVLWQKKIVHQDLKLANVLIKNGKFKITDFGFSILQQRYIISLTREGTLQYMPYQKLTDPNYQADQKTDVYALGIMMYEIITKMHPYINQKNIKTQKQFVTILRGAQLCRPKIVNNFSAPLQGLLDLITRMVNKTPKNRISCSQIYDYIDNQQIFTQYRQRQYEKTQQIHLNAAAMTIIGKTSIYMVPFPIQPEEEQQYIQKLNNQKILKKNQENKKIIESIEQWVLTRRLYIYFFDRLCRRLFIQKIKNNFSSDKTHIYNKVILGCLLLQSKLARYILSQLKNSKTFQQSHLIIFKTSQQGVRCLKIIRRDQEYIREQLTDNLKRTNQLYIKQQKQLIELSQKQSFEEFNLILINYLKECIKIKADIIGNRADLVTLYYLVDAIGFIGYLPKVQIDLEFQEYFYSTQMKSKAVLMEIVEKYFEKNQIMSNYQVEIYEEEALMVPQEQ